MLLQVDYAAMALESGDTATAQSALADAKVSAKATAELLNSFLELARLDWSADKCTVSRFDVAAMVEQCLASVRGLAEQKGLELRADVPTGFAFRTDRVKLERVVSNLLSNAVKFTDGGRVAVELARAGGTMRLVVSDTGAGISAEDQARLFEEFFQVNNVERDRKKGFGLGLAISRRLMRQLGGEIEFESKVGVGSRFSVVLPNTVVEDIAVSGEPHDEKRQVAVAAGRG
jgi:signal transduction histidine kinase